MVAQLTVFESTIYHKILQNPQSVQMIPIDIYASLLYYCEQTEQYENCILLKSLEDKVVLKSIDEFIDDFENV